MIGTAREARASRRAESLAARIEEGAAKLAAFVEGLSEVEWQTPVSLTDRRSIGVIVHHVATVYPIEIQLAKVIDKTAALELLRRNSREAATAVRSFTDQQLDTAASFSLSFGAPLTAQFVIEDHALRHSWHHLAGIKKALGR